MVADPQDLLAALKHPLRRRILKLMLEHPDQVPLSPRDLSRRLGQPLSNVSYHVRTLVAADALQLCDTEPVRGSVRHLYQPTERVAHTRWVLETLKLDPPAG